MRERPQTSLVASPILIGAVTVLVAVVAVFLSYNANNGLPFVPTYDITAQVPDAAGLVRGNDVRIGGKRVGFVTTIAAKKDARGNTYAALALTLDKTAEPIYADTGVTIRPRSPLGLKYVELNPRKTGRKLPQNGTLAIGRATPAVDLDQVLDTFDQATRRSLQLTVAGLGDGTAGRGVDVNQTLAAAPELLSRVNSVSANLADPRTALDGFVRGVDRTASQLATVTPQLGSLVQGADVTAGALAGVRPQLEQVLGELPPTESTATQALAVATPVLRDARVLVHDIQPGTRELPAAAARLHAALQVGIPVLRRASALSDRLRGTLTAVDQLAADPLTVGSLQRLLATRAVAAADAALRRPRPGGLQLLRPLDAQRRLDDLRGRRLRDLVPHARRGQHRRGAGARQALAGPAREPVRQHRRAGSGARSARRATSRTCRASASATCRATRA